jgi:hypothetical protein
MATIAEIYSWFMTGKKPTQAQFWASWGSFWNKSESIPQSAVSNLTTVLNAKTEKIQFDAHKTDANAHIELFGSKEDKTQKGVSNGYVPLNGVIKIASQYLDIVNDLVSGGSTSLLSAEQGKLLQTQITAINTLLTSNDINLDTVQELVDAIKEVETSLQTILVNDLTTGGTTKALTAEMGKSLKALIDALGTSKLSISDLSQDIETNKISTTKTGSVKAFYDWCVGKFQSLILSIETTSSISYTISLNTIHQKTVFTATNPIAFTVPTNASVSIPIGQSKLFAIQGSGTLTIQGSGIIFIGTTLVFKQGNTIKLTKVATDTWVVDGNAGTSIPAVTTGEKLLSITSAGVQANYDVIDPFTGVTSVATLDAADWSTGSVTATGVAGERRFGSTYEYVCSGTNNWRRNINYGMIVKDFSLGDINDTSGVKTSLQMSSLYPDAVSLQIVIGVNGFYQFFNLKGWFYFSNSILT